MPPRIPGLLVYFILATTLPACALFAPPAPQPGSIPAVPPEQAAYAVDYTGASGEARFSDPLSRLDILVRVSDAVSGASIEGVQVGYASNGPQAVVYAIDLQHVYASRAMVIDLAEAYDATASPPAAAARLPLFTYDEVWQDPAAWNATYQPLPGLERFAANPAESCAPARPGARVPPELYVTKFVVAGPDPAASFAFGAATFPAALGELAQIAERPDASGSVLETYRSLPPALIRWRIYRFADDLPYLAQPAGLCLQPYDPAEPQSALDWARYGLEQREDYVFQVLLAGDIFYARNIDGGQVSSPQEFLSDLRERLQLTAPTCDGYTFEAGQLRIWSSGWALPWKMTQECLTDCQPLDPPWESATAGVTLRQTPAGWRLSHIVVSSERSRWVEQQGLALRACDAPVQR